jgi:hypothetical protein
MTPYRERREAGEYSPTGEKTASTTTDNLGGHGAPQKVEQKPKTKAKATKK